MSGSAKRLFLEGFVVIVSILMAFGLDAAWDSAQLRGELRSDLENVIQELHDNQARVAFHVDMAVRIRETLIHLEDALAASGASQVVVPDTTAWLAVVYPSLNPSLGAVDALIASGRMEAIEDHELARRLAGLRDVFEDAVEEQLASRTVFNQHMVPFIGAVKRGTRYVSDSFWAGERIPGRGLAHEGDVGFPNNPVVRGSVGQIRGNYVVLVAELSALAQELSEIEVLAQAERSK